MITFRELRKKISVQNRVSQPLTSQTHGQPSGRIAPTSPTICQTLQNRLISCIENYSNASKITIASKNEWNPNSGPPHHMASKWQGPNPTAVFLTSQYLLTAFNRIIFSTITINIQAREKKKISKIKTLCSETHGRSYGRITPTSTAMFQTLQRLLISIIWNYSKASKITMASKKWVKNLQAIPSMFGREAPTRLACRSPDPWVRPSWSSPYLQCERWWIRVQGF